MVMILKNGHSRPDVRKTSPLPVPFLYLFGHFVYLSLLAFAYLWWLWLRPEITEEG